MKNYPITSNSAAEVKESKVKVNDELCPVCGALKQAYLEMMHVPCQNGHKSIQPEVLKEIK